MVVYQGKIANADSDVFEGQIEIGQFGYISRVVNLLDKITDTPDRVFPSSCIIFPGFGDTHIHARQDQTGKQMYKEEYRTAANAALNGGVVFVCAIVNTPQALTTMADWQWHKATIENLNHSVEIIPYVGIGKNTSPLRGLRVFYKCFVGPSIGDLFFENRLLLRNQLQHYRGLDVSFHVEDFDVLKKHEHEKTHSKRRPVECVEAALEYLLPMIEEFDIRAKLCHWSTGGRSLEMIAEHRERMAKKCLGHATTIEISPLHLLFDEEMLAETPEFWPYVQMNPAIQGSKHRSELIEALRSGFIDFVSTDHAPHTLNEKFKMFTLDGLEAVEKANKKFTNLTSGQVSQLKDYIRVHSSWGAEQIARRLAIDNIELCRAASCEDGTSGAPWLDTYAQVMAYLINACAFKPQDIARIASYNPGCFVNQFLEQGNGKGFGRIEKSYLGSLTVINLEKSSTVKRSELQTKCGWSPLEWRNFPGSLEAVIINGEDCTKRFVN